MRISHFFALMFIILMACKTSKNRTEKPSNDMNTITFERLKAGEYCGVNEAKQVLITSNEAWLKLWNEVHKNKVAVPEALAVDFSQKWVVACFMGMRNSGGYGIEIEKIALGDDEIHVKTIESAPGKNCMMTMALTQPYVFVLIDQQNVEKISYESSVRREDC